MPCFINCNRVVFGETSYSRVVDKEANVDGDDGNHQHNCDERNKASRGAYHACNNTSDIHSQAHLMQTHTSKIKWEKKPHNDEFRHLNQINIEK